MVTESLSPEDILKWHRHFAIETNNLAWTLAEKPARTPAETEEMLHAAHTSAFHWSRAGTAVNKARADMLLGQAHALAGNASLALLHAQRSHTYFTSHETTNCELAFSHAILANAARVANSPSPIFALSQHCKNSRSYSPPGC